jgi:predicted phosphodiesterase
MVNGSDLVAYCSGDATHLGSLGGAITSAKVISKQSNNGFVDLDYSSATLYIDHYVCFYIKNTNTASEKLLNVTLYLEFNSTNPNQIIKIAKGTAAKNAAEQTIANNQTAPTGVIWYSASSYANGVLLADTLEAGDYKSYWIWRRNVPNSLQSKGAKFRLVVAGDPEAGSTPGGSGEGNPPEPPPPPPPPVNADVRVGASSDFSCNSDAQETVDKLIAANCDIYVLPGDLSTEDSADCFVDMWSSATGRVYLGFGNHDREEGAPASLTDEYLTAFNLPNTYYSVINKGIQFVAVDPYESYGEGSTQYNYIKRVMEEHKTNSSVYWRFIFWHEFPYTSPSDHGTNNGLRDAYHPLIDANGFDFILCGHNHNYFRTYPIRYNGTSSPTIVAQAQEPNYTNPGAPILMLTGPAGQSSRDSFDSQSSFVAKQSSSDWGYTLFEFTDNMKKCTIKHFFNSGTLYDTATVTKT